MQSPKGLCRPRQQWTRSEEISAKPSRSCVLQSPCNTVLLTLVHSEFERICSTPESHPRRSLDDLFSSKAHSLRVSTPPHKSQGRQLFLKPKATTGSLRQRLHAKRDSLLSTSTRQSIDSEASILGPETFVTPPLSAQDDKKHETFAKAIVGSLRGMTHKHRKNGTLAAPGGIDPSTIDGDTSHDSPVDVPSAAPALENLDFGGTGFELSPSGLADSSPNDEHTSSLPKPGPDFVTANTIAAANSPGTERTLGSRHLLSRRHPIAPRDILKLHFADDGKAPCAVPAPATAMPDTALALEIDGAWGTEIQLFDRSVTPADEKERQKLRSMRSLDAMAEACVKTPNHDAAAEAAFHESPVDREIPRPPQAHQQKEGNEPSVPGSPAIPPSTTVHALHPTTRRNLVSAETVHTIPSYMSELTRQNSPQMSVLDVAPEKFDDPFADRHALNARSPSSDRSVRLPFRPKRHSHEQSLAELEDGPLEPIEPPSTQVPGAPSARSSASLPDSLEEQLQLQRNYAIAEGLGQVDQMESLRDPSQESDPFVSVGSDDDTATRAQELLTSDIVLPNYDNLDSDDDGGLSPHGGPLPPTFEAGETSNNPSPRSVRSRSTYTAGLGDAQYVFSFDNWLRDSSGATSPDHPVTPDRRRTDMSLDSVSDTGNKDTPPVSPSTSTPNRHTLSLGNSTELGLRRAQRNMRYNALQIFSSNGTVIGRHTTGRHQSTFLLGESDETNADVIQFSSFDNAYRGSPTDATQNDGSAMQPRVGSDESVAEAIRNAARDYNQLQEQLNEPDDVFADPAENVEEPFRFNRSATLSPVKGKGKDPALEPVSSPDSGYKADASSIGAGLSSPFARR